MSVCNLLTPNKLDLISRSITLGGSSNQLILKAGAGTDQETYTINAISPAVNRTLTINNPFGTDNESQMMLATPDSIVVQAGLFSSPVTLNSISGRISTRDVTLTGFAQNGFILNNSCITTGKNVYLTLYQFNPTTPPTLPTLTTGFPILAVTQNTGTGSARINVINASLITLSGSLEIGFLIC